MSNVEQLFMFVSHLYLFFGEMSAQVFFLLFDWVVCFSGIELYELLVYFGNLSFVSCFIFTLLIVCFAVQKLLSLIRSDLFTFVFICITLAGGS